MTLLVKTFKDRCYASTNSQADELAASMLEKLLKYGYPEEYCWVKVIECDTQDFRIISAGNLADHLINSIDSKTHIQSTRWIRN